MIIDKSLILSDSQAIVDDAPSTNVIDLGAMGKTGFLGIQLKRNLGRTKKVPLLIQVTETFLTCTSLTVQFQSDDASNFPSPKTLQEETVLLADLKAGKILNMDCFPSGIKEQFVRLNFVVNGANATAGKIFAGVVGAVDDK